MRILQEGGNAFDAAVATAAAVGVLDPRMSSIGGGGFATVYVSKTQEVRALNFYGSAPKRATVSLYQGKDYSHGFLSAPVPSCLKGYEALHKAYGRLPWVKVLQPATELAENGFVVRQGSLMTLGSTKKYCRNSRISGATMSALRAKGYGITSVRDDDGRVNGIVIDPVTNLRLGGANHAKPDTI